MAKKTPIQKAKAGLSGKATRNRVAAAEVMAKPKRKAKAKPKPKAKKKSVRKAVSDNFWSS